MNPEQKKFLISEYALLQKDARQPGGMDAVLGDINEHNKDAMNFAKSRRFDSAVNNIEQVRLNLAGLDLDAAVENFRWSQTVEGKHEEARKALAHKTTDLVRKALEEKNAKANGNEKKEDKPEEKKIGEAGDKKEEKKDEKAALPTV
jgi:hypothetical protein